jgi:hypothetical protein
MCCRLSAGVSTRCGLLGGNKQDRREGDSESSRANAMTASAYRWLLQGNGFGAAGRWCLICIRCPGWQAARNLVSARRPGFYFGRNNERAPHVVAGQGPRVAGIGKDYGSFSEYSLHSLIFVVQTIREQGNPPVGFFNPPVGAVRDVDRCGWARGGSTLYGGLIRALGLPLGSVLVAAMPITRSIADAYGTLRALTLRRA